MCSGAPRARASSQGVRGRDYEQEVEITLEEAFAGTTRVLSKDGQRLEVKIPAGARTGTKVRLAGPGHVGHRRAGGRSVPRRQGAAARRRSSAMATICAASCRWICTRPSSAARPSFTRWAATSSSRFRPRRSRAARSGWPDRGCRTCAIPRRAATCWVKVRVMIPQHLTERERELFQELAQLRPSRRPVDKVTANQPPCLLVPCQVSRVIE